MVGLAACHESMSVSQSDKPVSDPVMVVGATLPSRPLRMGHPPNLSVKTSTAEYSRLADYLGQSLGHDVYIVVPDSYDEVVQLLVDGKLDFALLTPFLYVRAKTRMPTLKLVASLLGEGAPQYRGYIVTAATSPYHSVSDLRGKRFAFVDRASASGYLFPTALLHENNLNPEQDFREVVYAGSHPQVVEWVLSGRVDAGAISSTTFMHMRGEAISSRLFILAKTDWIPFDAFVAHPAMPASAVQRVRTALLSIDARTAEGREILTGVTTNNGFVEANETAYDPVRKVAARLGVQ